MGNGGTRIFIASYGRRVARVFASGLINSAARCFMSRATSISRDERKREFALRVYPRRRPLPDERKFGRESNILTSLLRRPFDPPRDCAAILTDERTGEALRRAYATFGATKNRGLCTCAMFRFSLTRISDTESTVTIRFSPR